MIDLLSYILGRKAGQGEVVIDGENITFADDGEGNITVTVTTEQTAQEGE